MPSDEINFWNNYDEFGGHMRITSEREWTDIMQVCLKGHVITDSYKSSLESRKDFCPTCGSQTITTCPNCQKEIPGVHHIPNIAGLWDQLKAPAFCEGCGEPFPWSNKNPDDNFKGNQIKPMEALQSIFINFHTFVKQLKRRYNDRNTFEVNDEYDVQDLLKAILFLFFDDVRPEEVTPSHAGKSARMDFLLKNEEIVVETKMTRKGLTEKELGDELVIDIARYSKHPNCTTLVCFLYDPHGFINNPKGLISDLQKHSKDGLKVHVFINPM